MMGLLVVESWYQDPTVEVGLLVLESWKQNQP
jgi:hypothetical protein